MNTSSWEKDRIRREELGREYNQLSQRERVKISRNDYIEQELVEEEGDGFWKGLGMLALAIICLAVIFH